MSYTNSDLIRNHLEYIQPVTDSIVDQQIILDDDEYNLFFSGSILTDSIKVKSMHDYKLQNKSFTLTSGINSITNSPLVPGSIVCTSDSSLGIVYNENIDFIIRYFDGSLLIKPGGSLSVGMDIFIFYLPFTLYVENQDYRINYDNGSIQKINSGDIMNGETVYLDYHPIFSSFTDDIVNNAVVEANSIVEMRVDPNQQFGANLVLQTAATYRALEILCRSSAVRELASHAKNDRTALAWMKLADLYLMRSNELIKAFIEPTATPNFPTHS